MCVYVRARVCVCVLCVCVLVGGCARMFMIVRAWLRAIAELRSIIANGTWNTIWYTNATCSFAQVSL